MVDRAKIRRQAKQNEELHYKHFTYLNRPIIQPSVITIDCYSRLLMRSPTPNSRYEDSVVERSSINTLISINGIATPLTNETLSEDGDVFSEGFDPDRFVSTIDDHFMCPFCKKVVRKPQECIYCQNLMCKHCISNNIKCPFGCDNLFVKNPSKFAMLSYLKLKIKCVHYSKGCEATATLKDISEHEKECEFSEVKCINPVCSVFFSRNKGKGPEVCSEICGIVVGFKNVLDTQPQENFLKEFVEIIDKSRGNIQLELRSDLEELIEQAQKKKEEFEEFLRSKEELYGEIEVWRTLYHSGKWNQVVKWWTCCENKEKYSKGCTLIP